MSAFDHILHPSHCFCQVPDEDLRPWVVKRYVEGCSTLELLNSTDDPYHKELISIVALLDVDDETLLEMMGNVHLPQHHILHCRDNVRRILGLADPS
ncbi:hypothetical protein [Porticoccus sp.]